MFFSLHVVSIFSFLFLWSNSSFMPLWSEKMLKIISVLLYLLRLVLCPSMWSVLEKIPGTLEKSVYSGLVFFFFFFFFDVLKIPILSVLLCHLGLCSLDFLSRGSVCWCEWDVSHLLLLFSHQFLLLCLFVFVVCFWVLLY